jgi:hypothetical protein
VWCRWPSKPSRCGGMALKVIKLGMDTKQLPRHAPALAPTAG